jgi:DNA-binding MarR family transcriptional regulator
MAPNSVTTAANGLKSSGLITRAAADKDAKAVVLTLTDDGLRELTQAIGEIAGTPRAPARTDDTDAARPT